MERVRKIVGDTNASGVGVTVAVLDTGIGFHPDLEDNLAVFKDFVDGKNYAYDDSGHGTHVCGIIAGSGRLSGGRFKGIAPGVKLAVGKVLDKNGDGNIESMLEGINWILKIKDYYNIRVLNISVGIGQLTDKKREYLLRDALENAWSEEIAVICAAGNNGPSNGTISTMGKSRKIITVGCHDGGYFKEKSNCCESYSGRGDFFSPIRKPDIVAPGTDILSCNASYNAGYDHISKAYVKKSGTSMATPIVSGAAALFFERYPGKKCEDFKRALTHSAVDLNEPWNKQGFGMLNIAGLLDEKK